MTPVFPLTVKQFAIVQCFSQIQQMGFSGIITSDDDVDRLDCIEACPILFETAMSFEVYRVGFHKAAFSLTSILPVTGMAMRAERYSCRCSIAASIFAASVSIFLLLAVEKGNGQYCGVAP